MPVWKALSIFNCFRDLLILLHLSNYLFFSMLWNLKSQICNFKAVNRRTFFTKIRGKSAKAPGLFQSNAARPFRSFSAIHESADPIAKLRCRDSKIRLFANICDNNPTMTVVCYAEWQKFRVFRSWLEFFLAWHSFFSETLPCNRNIASGNPELTTKTEIVGKTIKDNKFKEFLFIKTSL